jgi:hypothetical protein
LSVFRPRLSGVRQFLRAYPTSTSCAESMCYGQNVGNVGFFAGEGWSGNHKNGDSARSRSLVTTEPAPDTQRLHTSLPPAFDLFFHPPYIYLSDISDISDI